MVKKTVLKNVQKYLLRIKGKGIPVCFGVIFGSQVTGRAGKWSDIDLLVVSPRFDRSPRRKDIEELWYQAALTDSRIEPIPCGEKQWKKDRFQTIIEIARREGQVIGF